MKKLAITAVVFLFVGWLFGRQSAQEGYVIEHEKDIVMEQEGPHDGGGKTKVSNFFIKVPGFKKAFRKRTLLPGSAIGYHLQKEEEIYYILSGSGEMNMNGKTFTVTAGDAILTRPGNSHGLKPLGNENLSLIINYNLPG